ncbi:MAG TPA: phage holin family protein [Firmicutes bacterium]|nr:phage holin family protein [Bacillota bacterium]
MAGFLLRCIFNGIILITAIISLPGIFVDTMGAALVSAVLHGLGNAVIRPGLNLLEISVDSTVLGWTTIITNITLPTLAFRVLPGIEIHGLITVILLFASLSAGSYVFTRCIQDR